MTGSEVHNQVSGLCQVDRKSVIIGNLFQTCWRPLLSRVEVMEFGLKSNGFAFFLHC